MLKCLVWIKLCCLILNLFCFLHLLKKQKKLILVSFILFWFLWFSLWIVGLVFDSLACDELVEFIGLWNPKIHLISFSALIWFARVFVLLFWILCIDCVVVRLNQFWKVSYTPFGPWMNFWSHHVKTFAPQLIFWK